MGVCTKSQGKFLVEPRLSILIPKLVHSANMNEGLHKPTSAWDCV